MEKKNKKIMIVAVAIVAIFLMAGLVYLVYSPSKAEGYETGKATLADMLASTSQRSDQTVSSLVVSKDSPLYALLGTPVALYYTGTEKTTVPLLVRDKNQPSRAVEDVSAYLSYPQVTAFGDIGTGYGYQIVTQFDGAPHEMSLEIAKAYWVKTDGVILVKYDPTKANDIKGYEAAVMVASLSSYLNIPVIVTDHVDQSMADTLAGFGVKYTIVCGDMSGYKKTWHVVSGDSTITEFDTKDCDYAYNIQQEIVKQRIQSDVKYIAVANGLDTYKPVVVASQVYNFTGEASNSDAAAYPGAAPSTGGGNPFHYFDIPEDYTYSLLKVDFKIDISQEQWGDLSGARGYIFLGVDGNEDGTIDPLAAGDYLYYFGGTPGYENIGYNPEAGMMAPSQWGHLYTEIPLMNERTDDGAPIVTHAVEVLAKLPTDWGNNRFIAEEGDYSAEYILTIEVQKVESPIFPRQMGASSMAPYLAAYRQGIVLTQPQFQIYDGTYLNVSRSGEPCANENALPYANEQAKYVKGELLRYLGALSGTTTEGGTADAAAIASYYSGIDITSRPMVALVGDSNNVPVFYHNTSQVEATQGYGMPSDIFYSDIDMDMDDPPFDIGGADPTFELATGRVDGWDAQDISAILVRTFFYNQIIDRMSGPHNGKDLPEWKDSAMTSVGMEPPVGASITASNKIAMAFTQAGFNVEDDELWKQDQCRRQRAGLYYESSNFIWFCAHGFYYWYVPPAAEGMEGILPPISAGGAFDVAHIKEMKFGPSVLFAESCVTGRTDGLYPNNCLSLAYMHAGFAAYIGANRMSWGNLLPGAGPQEGESMGGLISMYFYAHLTGFIYNKAGGLTSGFEPGDLTTGQSLCLAKTEFMASEGTDGGMYNDDTTAEFCLHGDPAFNPYEPVHGYPAIS